MQSSTKATIDLTREEGDGVSFVQYYLVVQSNEYPGVYKGDPLEYFNKSLRSFCFKLISKFCSSLRD